MYGDNLKVFCQVKRHDYMEKCSQWQWVSNVEFTFEELVEDELFELITTFKIFFVSELGFMT